MISLTSHAHRIAFSLVELSIVLVILGLLVGGILSGRSLIRASELRTITTQYNSYYAATRAFRDKYFALPGDMANATTFWGAAAAPGLCGSTASTDAKTCDGDGDVKIANPNSAFMYESERAWQHLSNAALIEGSYNGTTTRPSGKLANSRWHMEYFVKKSADPNFFDGDYENSLVFHTYTPAPFGFPPILSPIDMWSIDAKLDDGNPATGKIAVYATNGLDKCTDAVGTNAVKAASLTASYLLTSSSIECSIVFRQQF